MAITVYPLAFTAGDFKTLVKLAQDIGEVSPIRGLDESHLKPSDPAAFLACLDFENDPIKHLQNHSTSLFEHFNFSFAVICENSFQLELLTNTKLKMFVKRSKKLCIIILSASVAAWVDVIASGCVAGSDEDLRTIMNQCFNILNSTGYRELFRGYQRDQISDGTFLLR